jgi:hypothetical protein
MVFSLEEDSAFSLELDCTAELLDFAELEEDLSFLPELED